MKPRYRPLVGIGILVLGGLVRMPLEQGVVEDFRNKGLLPEPLQLSLRERIGQNSSVIALAGLRTLVATFSHLKATEFFTVQDWPKVEDSMETVVQLVPRDAYYRDMGAWHKAYNAASYYLNDSGLPPLIAKAESRRWTAKGREFLERGIRNSPNDWRMYASLGHLLSDTNRSPDPEAAEAAYAGAIATGNAPAYLERFRFFAEVRAGKHSAETLEKLHKLLEVQRNRVPTMLCILYSLEYQLNEPDDPLALALEVFGTEKKALRNLGSYFVDIRESLPMNGVETAIRILEAREGIAPEDERSFIHFRKEVLKRNGLER